MFSRSLEDIFFFGGGNKNKLRFSLLKHAGFASLLGVPKFEL